jgi:diaminohydroxyphosphoribosylaminopyrimidine deaminase/5-amino-6-(5-phosphoribosylamino)uracil reductase
LTNVLVVGGAGVLGSLLDARLIDEVHVFVARKLIGGRGAPSPVAGQGIQSIREALPVVRWECEHVGVGDDVYLHGWLTSTAVGIPRRS